MCFLYKMCLLELENEVSKRVGGEIRPDPVHPGPDGNETPESHHGLVRQPEGVPRYCALSLFHPPP